MTAQDPLGYVTVRIPIHAVTESESWEMPQEYTYLQPGDAELVTHDIPQGWHESLREQLIEFGLSYAPWTQEEIAAKSTRPPEPHRREPAVLLLNFPKEP